MAINVIVELANGTFAGIQCQWRSLSSILLRDYTDQSTAEKLVTYPLNTSSTLSDIWPANSVALVYVWNKTNSLWNVGTAPDALAPATSNDYGMKAGV